MTDMDMDKTYLGTRVKQQRIKLGYTQAQLAEFCDLSLAAIGHIERGLRFPSMDVFIKLCQVLKVAPNDLLQDYFDPALLSASGTSQFSPRMLRALSSFVAAFENEQSDEDY